MATLYELAQAMRDFRLEIDEETGEIINGDELDNLQMEHDEKLKNCVLFYKNRKADAEMLKAEEKKIAARRKAAERDADWMLDYIDNDLQGEKFEPEDDVRIRVRYRKSESVECEDITKVDAKYLRIKDPEVDKVKAKKDLRAGIKVNGCKLVNANKIRIL